MRFTLFDLNPSLESRYWYADEAADIILFGAEFPGNQSKMIFAFAAELTRAADRGEIEYRAYTFDEAAEIARLRQPRIPPQLLARSAIEWALQRPERVIVSEETAFWYSTLVRQANPTPPVQPPKKRAIDGYMAAILEEIAQHGYDRHAIPLGAKAELQRCLVETGRMTKDNFLSAWKVGSTGGRLAIEGRARFAKGGSKK